MLESVVEIKSKKEAMAAWDREGVIIKMEDGYVYVYPQLGRGYIYPDFDLRRVCNLMGFYDVEQAVFWAKSRGYTPYVMGKSHVTN